MKISDETLMAFADGELDGAARTEVELAMREDPQIEKRIAAHRAMRERLQAAYAGELLEQIPDRLKRGVSRARPARTRWRVPASMAASLIVGLSVGYFVLHPVDSPLMRNASGAMIARGPLEAALSKQLAAEQSPASPVRIGLSFLAKSGDYCRTFVLSGETSPAGLACRRGARWQVLTLSEERAAEVGESGYRAAGSAVPAAILEAVEDQISGEPLDQAGESAARGRDWKSAGR
jgi:anti-sigma factor RsiW